MRDFMSLKTKKILKIAVSFGILIFLLTHVDFKQIEEGIKYLSFSFVVFSLLYYTVCQWLRCIKWEIILRSTGCFISMTTLLSSYFGGMFLNTFLPGSVGGDAYRVYRIAQKNQELESAVVSVFLDRTTGIFALLIIALSSIPVAFRVIGSWDIILLIFICTAILLAIVLLIGSPKLLVWTKPWFKKLHLESITTRLAKIQILLRKFAQNPMALALTLSLSIVFQLLVVLYYYLIAQQLKIPVSYLQLLVFTAIIVVITLLPISLGGLGVKEGLLAYLFSRVHLTIEDAILLSLTVTALGWLLSLPGGLILLLDLYNKKN